MSAVNVALPAFAAARHAAAPCGRGAGCAAINRYIPTRRAHSSKPAARCCSWRMGQTDGWTDAVRLHRLYSAYYAGNANNDGDDGDDNDDDCGGIRRRADRAVKIAEA